MSGFALRMPELGLGPAARREEGWEGGGQAVAACSAAESLFRNSELQLSGRGARGASFLCERGQTLGVSVLRTAHWGCPWGLSGEEGPRPRAGGVPRG